MGRFFQTDGVRGVANVDLTVSLALRIGIACGQTLKAQSRRERPALVIGRDSRVSGAMLEAGFVAGACSTGVDVYRAGIIPTPAVAWLCRSQGYDGGVMISASHNPVADNGIKVFAANGFKISDEVEARIESMLLSGCENLPSPPTGIEVGDVISLDDAEDRYVAHLLQHVKDRLDGLRLVLDCAYGAAWHAAPRLFRALGAQVVALHDRPDGSKINVACGSTDLSALSEAVTAGGAHLGLAFDGDADRCLAVDEAGQRVDGDQMLAAFARTSPGAYGRTVVATVMSNLGLQLGLAEQGIELRRASVGDRFVLEEMMRCGATLGGEQSGHVIFLDAATTGDGILTGARLASLVSVTGRPLCDLARLEPVPQMLVNVRTVHKERLNEDNQIASAIAEVEHRLSGRGRLLVRASGTEPLVRVMAEGPDEDEIRGIVSHLVAVIEDRLGRG